MLKLATHHICHYGLGQVYYRPRQMYDCSLGDNSPPVFSWLELVAEETGCNPGDTFEGQVAAGFILNNLKRNIQPLSQKPDCTPHRRSHVYLSWRDFPGRDDDT